MVLSGSLRVVLLCLLSLRLRGTEAQVVNQNALARIIHNIQNTYCPRQGDQFAVAINVNTEYCTDPKSSLDDFLKSDKPTVVKKDMTSANKIYEGVELIGATIKYDKNTDSYFHSEYLLLNPLDPRDSPMMRLLEKKKDGCVIVYTYNSPCDKTCLNKEKERNILTALGIFKEHKGPQAFVYSYIFEGNRDGILDHGVEINDNVPLYSCYSVNGNYECHLCVKDKKIVEECLL